MQNTKEEMYELLCANSIQNMFKILSDLQSMIASNTTLDMQYKDGMYVACQRVQRIIELCCREKLCSDVIARLAKSKAFNVLMEQKELEEIEKNNNKQELWKYKLTVNMFKDMIKVLYYSKY